MFDSSPPKELQQKTKRAVKRDFRARPFEQKLNSDKDEIALTPYRGRGKDTFGKSFREIPVGCRLPRRNFLRSRLRPQSEPARKLIPLVTQSFLMLPIPLLLGGPGRPIRRRPPANYAREKFPNAFSFQVIIHRRGEMLKRRTRFGMWRSN